MLQKSLAIDCFMALRELARQVEEMTAVQMQMQQSMAIETDNVSMIEQAITMITKILKTMTDVDF